jgi:hypothetical protein
MPRTGQQLAMLVLAHLFSSFFDHAAQQITPILHKIVQSNKLVLLYHRRLLVHIFLFARLQKKRAWAPRSSIDP